MIKAMVLVKRRMDVDLEVFRDGWSKRSDDQLRRRPTCVSYVCSYPRLGGYRNGEPRFDGVAELSFDVDTITEANSSFEEVAPYVLASDLIDPEHTQAFFVEDIVIKDGHVPAEGLKYIVALRRKKDVSVEQFRHHWLYVHGPIAARNPTLARYVQSHVLQAVGSHGDVDFDGVASTWFADMEAVRASGSTSEYRETLEDEANFLEPDAQVALLMDEQILITRPRRA